MKTGRIVHCPKCSVSYELHEHPTIMRDKDSVCCEDCYTDLYSWNGGSMFTIKRIDRPETKEVITP